MAHSVSLWSLTPAEFAEQMRVPLPTVHSWLRQPDFPQEEGAGGRPLIPFMEAQAWVAERCPNGEVLPEPARLEDLPAQAVATISEKLARVGDRADVPYTGKEGTFTIRRAPHGVECSNLGAYPLLTWRVFSETVSLLVSQNGRAAKGDAMTARLGEPPLPLDSVEGHIAATIYGKQVGDSVFRRIVPISAILVWAGICATETRELMIAPTHGPRAVV